MDYDLGYVDLEEKTLQLLDNPFVLKVLRVWPVRSVTYVSEPDMRDMAEEEGFEPPRPFRA